MKKLFLTISLWVVWITLASFSSFAQDALPKEENKREADLVELNELDKTIKLDILYARADNFVGRAVYTEARAFMVRLYENRLPFSDRSIETVKDILINEKTDQYVLRAKTGWSNVYTPQVDWLVGYVERGRDVYFFATEIDIKKDEDAAKRLETTKNILKSLQII